MNSMEKESNKTNSITLLEKNYPTLRILSYIAFAIGLKLIHIGWSMYGPDKIDSPGALLTFGIGVLLVSSLPLVWAIGEDVKLKMGKKSE